ncbi:MAG: valine--tRNA ligase [Candidatus Aenigmatarchaeota archaeon]
MNEPKIKEKTWNMQLEKAIAKKWLNEKPYKLNEKSKKIFSIDTPPPYPSGKPWHIGAAAHYSQIDMIARTARMLGFAVHFPIGIDRNGLPVEMYTEKKYGIKLQDVSREKFTELCTTALDDLEEYMLNVMRIMGMSGDFDNYYRTDSRKYRALTQNTFIELWNRKLIYEDTRPNNYCIDCKTTIADAEIVYQDMQTQLVYVRFKVVEGGEIIVATTRPELLCSCQLVMVHPDDDRYRDFVGKHATIPLFERNVPIIAHPYANPEFGSGVVMMCSYGDYSDVRIFRELNLKEIIAIDVNGRMADSAGKYSGMHVKEARKKITEDIEPFVEKKENIMHRTPMCERSKTPIEIIPMNEYYLKQTNFIPSLKKIAKKMEFHPKEHMQILMDWMNAVSMDWPISRRRYYATEIPIWYCKQCRKPHLPKQGYVQPWKEKFNGRCDCSCDEFIGEERTFDTWMDSSVSPLFIAKYKSDSKFFKRAFPNSVRPQGKDIIRTWLYYTLLRCYQLTDEQAFEHVWITGYGVDEKGEKMSKSKGNVIDPLPILERYGADSFRFWNAAEASLGNDYRCSEERIVNASKFLTKLWNVSRFISSFPKRKKARLTELDKWILQELDKLINECEKGYDDFNFFIPANKIREFVWFFASYYVELAKARAYGDKRFTKAERDSSLYTLNYCLETILKLLAPIAPYITDYIWREMYGKKCIHLEKFEEKKNVRSKIDTELFIDLNSRIWKKKKDSGLSLKAEIGEITIPKKFKCIEKDIVATHSVKKIKYGKEIRV